MKNDSQNHLDFYIPKMNGEVTVIKHFDIPNHISAWAPMVLDKVADSSGPALIDALKMSCDNL